MENNSNPKGIITLAKDKIKKEFENLGNIGRKEQAVSTYVHNVLCDACDQSETFAHVIYNFKRTLRDCLVEIMKGCGNAISDIDVYRSAIQFYFPNAEITATTTISLTGDPPPEDEINKAPEPIKETKKSKGKPAKAEPPKKTDKAKKPTEENQNIQLSLF